MNTQRQQLKQQLRLTPQQLLLMRLLQLPVMQLEQHIKEEVEKNPLLELAPSPADDAGEASGEPMGEAAEGGDGEEDDFRGIDLDEYFDDDDYSYRERQERDPNYVQHQMELSEGEDFTAFLLQQVRLRDLDERQRTIAEELVGSIDGSGYLVRDVQLVANDLAFRANMEVEDQEVEQVLHVVQTLDPAGVGARTLQECLSLQLHRRPADDDTRLATTIVDHHFAQLSQRHYAALMTLLKVDEATLNRALDCIRHLNPKPGWGRGEEHKGASYVLPDFVVTREGDQLSFALSERNRPSLRLNNDYNEMLMQLSSHKQLSAEERSTVQFIKQKREAAQWLIDTLNQREQTLSATMQAILERQQAYFLSGNVKDLRPLRLKDIAEMTHLDESTISRVVNEKYVQTEFGTILLKQLFTKAVQSEDGDMRVTGHLKEALLQTIEQEDKRHPLTDEALTESLQAQGFRLSRRTVSKYRESLDIPPARLRKEL